MSQTNSSNGENGSAPSFRVIGTRPIRHDGVDKVTGRARYGADYSFPNMLHGKVLRSPLAHARIKSINVEKGPGAALRQGDRNRRRTARTSRPDGSARRDPV